MTAAVLSKEYEELSTAQQKQLISDCAASPATCQQKYGDVLTDSLVKQAIDRALVKISRSDGLRSDGGFCAANAVRRGCRDQQDSRKHSRENTVWMKFRRE